MKMQNAFTQTLWKNFGAAIGMLDNAIALCPYEVWQKEKKFFYLAYHSSIFLDYYLTQPVKNFQPALSYTIVDDIPAEAVDDVIPDRHYTQREMHAWLASIRSRCQKLIANATEEKLMQRWIEEEEVDLHGLCPSLVVNYTLLEILFYNLRHVQHHTAQLNFMLRQKANIGATWISLS